MKKFTTNTVAGLLISIGLCSVPAWAVTSATYETQLNTESTVSKTNATLPVRLKALDNLLDEQWEYSLRTNPEYASMLGDKRFNDQLRDFSQAAIDANLKMSREFLKRLKAIDTTGFDVQQKLNKDLMVRQLQEELEGARFQNWQMPVLQNSGVHLDTPELVTMLSFTSVKDYEDYLARLNKLPTLFEQTIVQMRKGVKNKIMPPQFLLPKIARQCDDIVAMSMETSPFAKPVAQFPADISEADQQRLRTAILAAIQTKVIPAYQILLISYAVTTPLMVVKTSVYGHCQTVLLGINCK